MKIFPLNLKIVSLFILLASVYCAFPFRSLYSQELSGELSEIKGNVEFLRHGNTAWYTAIEGMPVEANDRIKTSALSSCNLELDDGSLIFIDENTDASIDILELTAEKHTSSISLWFGKLISKVSKLKKTKMQIRTPTSVAAVRGTEFAVEANSGGTTVGVFEGAVAVNTPEGPDADNVLLKTDEETDVGIGMKPVSPKKLGAGMIRNREKMESLRERIKQLHEKLKRIPPEKRILARKKAIEKFQKIRSKRSIQKQELKQKHERKRNKHRQIQN